MMMMVSLQKKIVLVSQAILLLLAFTVKGYGGSNNLSPNQSIDPLSRSPHPSSRRPMPNHSPNRSIDPVSPSPTRNSPRRPMPINGSPSTRSINPVSPSSTFGRRPVPNSSNHHHHHRQNRVLSPLPSSIRTNNINSNNNNNNLGGRRVFPARPSSSFNNNRNYFGSGGATAAASSSLSSSSVAFMITTKMKRILIEDLQYSRKEVTGMSPDQAHQIINHRIFNPIFVQNRIPTDKCLGSSGDGNSEEECPISMVTPSSTQTAVGSNRVLEEMDDQFGEVTERVLKDDNYGGPLFPDQQQQQQQQQQTNRRHPHQNHHNNHNHVVPNESMRGRRTNTFPSSPVYRW